jgi:hypothetical protein
VRGLFVSVEKLEIMEAAKEDGTQYEEVGK